MKPLAAFFAIRCLIWETYRQSLASGLFWIMLAVSLVCILFCLSVGVTGGDPQEEWLPATEQVDPEKAKKSGLEQVKGELTMAFGAIRLPLTRDRIQTVRAIQLLLAGGVADTAGVLLALIWTAGFLPAFLDPSAASVALAKPVPRWSLLVGKFLGVLAFLAFQAVLFVGGTWLALGLGTGVYDPLYLWAIPLLLLHFAVFYSFSTYLAVCTRSTVACITGSLLFWLTCWGINYGRHIVVGLPKLEEMGPSFLGLVEVCYWIVPKPADLNYLLFENLQAGNFFNRAFDFQTVIARGAFHLELSILSSCLFAVVVLALACWQFVTTDY
jgi:ABC-type transport system involved in multi-copper enzyme maturation permease subunit